MGLRSKRVAAENLDLEKATIVVLGDGGCGKSSLIIRYVNDMFVDDYDPTIEDSFRKLVVLNERPVFLDIIDTAGQEEFTCLRDAWIRNADGFLLVCSLDSFESVESLVKLHRQIVQVKETETPPIVLAANKCDLHDHGKVYQRVLKLSKDIGCPLVETSAKTCMNIVECFISVIKEMNEKKMQDKESRQSIYYKRLRCTIL